MKGDSSSIISHEHVLLQLTNFARPTLVIVAQPHTLYNIPLIIIF